MINKVFKDKVIVGVFWGLLFSIITYFLLASINRLFIIDNFSPISSSTAKLISICINIIPIRYFSKKKMLNITTGFVTINFLLVVLYLLSEYIV